MQSFLAKCAAVSIVAGGFAATGDLGRLAARGQQLLEARTVPNEPLAQAPVEPPPAAPAVPPPAGPAFEKPLPAQPFAPAGDPGPGAAAAAAVPAPGVTTGPAGGSGASPAGGLFAAADPVATLGRPVAVPAPPSSGPDGIDVRRLAAGQRVLVWIRKPVAGAAGRSIDLLAFDIIDPETASALEYRHLEQHHAPAPATTSPVAVHAAPRRIMIAPTDAGRVSRGAALRVAPVRGVHGAGAVETLGTVLAIDLQGP